jgi:hypothetical protein
MSYISTLDIQNALDTQLQTVADLPSFTVENERTEAQNVRPYCRSTLAPSKSTVSSLGARPIIEQAGLYQIDLFYPVAYGFTDARTMADKVINAFPPSFLTLADGNNLIIITAWSQAGVGYSNDNCFWQIPVRVEWVIRTPV